MKINRLQMAVWLALSMPVAMAQAPAPAAPASAAPAAPTQGPGVQSARDAREPQVLATCKHPPAPPTFKLPPGFTPPTGEPQEYSVAGIAGVVAGEEQWKKIWSVQGNNADGLVGTDDGGLLIAQNSNSAVVKLDKDGNLAVLFKDTNTGGALSMSKKGALFIVQRGLYPSVWQLRPQRKLLADKYQGDPLDCLGSVINDLTADSHGGVYFTDGGLYYVDAKGVITKYGEDLSTNGIILSPDEKTLYVTNKDTVVAFDVKSGGALAHQRDFAKLPGAGAPVRSCARQGGGPRLLSHGRSPGRYSDAVSRHQRGVRRAGQENSVRGCRDGQVTRPGRYHPRDSHDRNRIRGPRQVATG